MHSHDSAFTSAGTLAVYYCRYRESRGGSPIRKTSVLSCVHHLFFHTSFSYFLRPRIIGQPRIFHPLLFVFDSFRDIFTRSKVFACCEPVCSFFLSSFYFIFCFNFFIFFFDFFSQFNPSVRKGERFPRLRSHDCLSNNYCNTVVGDYFIPNDYCELRSTDYFFSIPGIHPTEG